MFASLLFHSFKGIREEAELLRLDKDHFKKILSEVSNKIDFQSVNTREIIMRAKKRGFSLLGSGRILKSATKGIPEIDALAPDELEQLISRLSISFFPSGEYIFNRFEPSRECFMLLDGTVSLEGANDATFKISDRGTSFGQSGVLLGHTRAVSCRASSEDGAICLMIDQDTYHEMWKGRIDRHYSQIVSCMIERQTFGAKYDPREMSLVAACAVPLMLPRGARFIHPCVQSFPCWKNSVLMVIDGEVECTQDTGAPTAIPAGKLVPTRPFSASAAQRAKTGFSRPPGGRPNIGKRVIYGARSSRGSSSLAGPGMLIGKILERSESRSSNTKSMVSDTHIFCTRPSLIIGLECEHLRSFLKLDSLLSIQTRSKMHHQWIEGQQKTHQKVHKEQSQVHVNRQPIVRDMPGRSAKEQEAHEAKMRNQLRAVSKAAEKQMRLRDPLERSKNKQREAYHVFAGTDPKVTANRIMRKAAKIFEKDKSNDIESMLLMKGIVKGATTRNTTFEATMQRLQSERQSRAFSKTLPIKERWKRLGSKVKDTDAEQIRSSSSSTRSSKSRGNSGQKKRSSFNTSFRLIHGSTLAGPPPPSGRILALGQHRSAYLNAIFAQLGKQGIISPERSDGDESRTRKRSTARRNNTTPRKEEKKKKKKKKKKRKQPQVQQNEDVRRVTTALRRRLARGRGEKVPGVTGLFDSINFRSFV